MEYFVALNQVLVLFLLIGVGFFCRRAGILNQNSVSSLSKFLLANDNFDGGFRIAVNDGSAYYDYSAEAVVDMLSNYLSPKVTELLKEAK